MLATPQSHVIRCHGNGAPKLVLLNIIIMWNYLFCSKRSPPIGPKPCGWLSTRGASTCLSSGPETCSIPLSTTPSWTTRPHSITCCSSLEQTKSRARSLSTLTRYYIHSIWGCNSKAKPLKLISFSCTGLPNLQSHQGVYRRLASRGWMQWWPETSSSTHRRLIRNVGVAQT